MHPRFRTLDRLIRLIARDRCGLHIRHPIDWNAALAPVHNHLGVHAKAPGQLGEAANSVDGEVYGGFVHFSGDSKHSV